jgi:hypothetical protein
MDLGELQQLERQHFEAVCCINDTGGMSLTEVADTLARLNARLIQEYRATLILPKPPVHRDVPAHRALHQLRQQSLPLG